VDIGFGDPFPPNPELLAGSDILRFADLPPIRVPALPLEQHLAQKFHAFTRTYGDGLASTRVKDLIDMVLIRSTAAFTADRLADELARTFRTRGTHELPVTVPLPPDGWVTGYRALALPIGLDPDITTGHRLVAEFLDPILSTVTIQGAVWDPIGGTWTRCTKGAERLPLRTAAKQLGAAQVLTRVRRFCVPAAFLFRAFVAEEIFSLSL
jgi:hypothetical protein